MVSLHSLIFQFKIIQTEVNQFEIWNFSEILWELKLSDVALKLMHHDERLYAALANGTLTVIEVSINRIHNLTSGLVDSNNY